MANVNEDLKKYKKIRSGGLVFYFEEKDGRKLIRYIQVYLSKNLMAIEGEVEIDTVPPNSVGTEQIINGAVEEEDLHGDVRDKLTDHYDAGSRTLYINGARPSSDVGQGGGEDTDEDDLPGGGFNEPMTEEEGD